MKIVAGVDSNRAVTEIDAVTTEPPAQRQKRRRRVAKNTGLAMVALVKIGVAGPEQSMRRTVARMLSVFQTRVDIEREVVFVIERQRPKESDLIGGNFGRDQIARRAQVRFGAQPQRRAGVLRKRLIAARRRAHPGRVGVVKKIQKHLFVIAAQANHSLRILLTEVDYLSDTARHIRSAIDQIAEEDQLIDGFITRQDLQQTVKLCAASVNVADDEGFHIGITFTASSNSCGFV